MSSPTPSEQKSPIEAAGESLTIDPGLMRAPRKFRQALLTCVLIRADRLQEGFVYVWRYVQERLKEAGGCKNQPDRIHVGKTFLEGFPALKELDSTGTVLRDQFITPIEQGRSLMSLDSYLTLMALAKLVGLRVVIIVPVSEEPFLFDVLVDSGTPGLPTPVLDVAMTQEAHFSADHGADRLSHRDLALEDAIFEYKRMASKCKSNTIEDFRKGKTFFEGYEPMTLVTEYATPKPTKTD